MCGIAGYSFDSCNVFHTDFISRDLSLLSHRGPDADGSFSDSTHGVSLLHSRLSVLDTSNLGHQPMLSPDETVALVFNGEIYNFKELRDELISTGFTFHGNSDTEVLLNLYL